MIQTTLSNSILSPALQAFLQRHVNLHRVLWIVVAATFFIAWNRGLALLYGLFSLLAALLLMSYLMPKWQLRGIEVNRAALSEFTVGQPGSITYRLQATGTRYHIEIGESLDFADMPEGHIFFGRFAGSTTGRIRFICLRRGCFRLATIQLSSAYPFGVKTISRAATTEPLEVLVLPRTVSLSHLPMPLVAASSAWGDVLIPQKGGRDEFTGVREYVHGDELKNIHWGVSARHQQLVVKEYDHTNRPAMLVVLDCSGRFDVGNAPESTFEYAVTLAASMILRASRDGIRCFLAARDDTMRDITVPAYANDLFPLFELLARLTCDSGHAYGPVVARAHKRFPQANLVVTFRLASNPTPVELSPHATQIELEMDDDSFRVPGQPNADSRLRREGNRLIFPVHAGQPLETVFQ